MIYCAVLTVLILCCFNGVLALYMQLRKAGNNAHRITAWYAAHDQLVHDVRSAPAARSVWEQPNAYTIRWQQNNRRICWTIRNKRLVRITQKQEGAGWRHKATSVVLTHVTDLRFVLLDDGEYLHAVQFVLNGERATTVALRNGKVMR